MLGLRGGGGARMFLLEVWLIDFLFAMLCYAKIHKVDR